MLRPATPLTVLFFVAFVLLLISTISTPIVKGIPLARFNGVSLGVFGYCKPTGCSKIQIGYPVDGKSLFGNSNDNSDFSLPSSARSDLSSILIVHPVAAFLTLICFILAATSHLHSPSHSPRYLLALIIISIPTLLVTLLAFLVDILLFVPHLAWGGWIVLASTILILASGIITCAMRRTLVSRKARKKRIAENAEMNGENYYTRQAPPPVMAMDRAESPPPLPSQSDMSGTSGSDKLPKFATFDPKSATEEDMIPLHTRTPSNKTLPSMPGSHGEYAGDGFNPYGAPRRGGPGGIRGGRGGYNGARDDYGNPLPPSNAFGSIPPNGVRRDQSEPPRLRNRLSNETMNSQGSRGRGRGGFGQSRGYGRGGPRGGTYGPGPGRGMGGYGRGGIPLGPMAAGAGAGVMTGEWRRGQETPAPANGYGNGYPAQDRQGQYDGTGPAGYGRSPSAPGYGRRPSPGPPSAPGGYGRQQSPGPPSAPGGYGRGSSPGPPSAPGGYRRGPSPGPPSAPGGYGRDPSPGPIAGGYGYARGEPSPPPMPQYRNNPSPPSPITAHPGEDHIIGQAVEMDARHGSPSHRSPTSPQPMQLHDSNDDGRGFAGFQQNQEHRDSNNVYNSNEPYVPPRTAWTGNGNIAHGVNPPPNTVAIDPVELPVQNTPRGQEPLSSSLPKVHPAGHRPNQSSADNYYEDVDPRFAPDSADPAHQTTLTQHTQSSNTIPHALMPGMSNRDPSPHEPIHPTIEHIDPSGSYESFHEGQDGLISPAASDHSNMTSISQRGVNPNWRPQDGVRPAHLGVPSRRPAPPQQQRDMLLNSNPDFGLPGGPGGARGPAMPIIQHGQAF